MKINRGNFKSNLFFSEKTGVLNKKAKILEVGSGTGYMVKTLRNEGYDITGTEVNDNYIQFSQDEFGIKLLKLNDKKLPFKNNSFDIVMSFDVLEHIPNTNQHLKEVKRVLKEDGQYIFSTPNKLTNVPFEIIKEKSFTKYKKYHPSVYTYWGLKNKLINNSFTTEFHSVPLVNKYFVDKLRSQFGVFGVSALKVFNPDILPVPLKTNFNVIARLNLDI